LLGATESTGADSVFHPIVDELVRMAPCPTLVVRGAPTSEQWPPRHPIVPTNGSASSRAAAEVAFAMAAENADAEVLIINVVEEPGTLPHLELRERLIDAGRRMVDDLAALGKSQGVRVRTAVHTGAAVEDVLIGAALAGSVDLILLGTDVRVGTGRLFLGPRVERILSASPCPVLVVNGA